MSKPEPAATQNLEDILSSIRKSLAEESTEGLADLRPAAPKPVAAKPTPAPAAAPAKPASATEAPRGEGLSNRLAGALNGADTAGDDDLSDFFAHVPKKAAPEPTNDAPPKADANDPLWFLGRPQDDAAAKPAATTASELQRAPDGNVELSRPETLRSSFPPLFGGGRDAAVVARLPGDPLPETPAQAPAKAEAPPKSDVVAFPATAAPDQAAKPAAPEMTPSPSPAKSADPAKAGPAPAAAQPAKPSAPEAVVLDKPVKAEISPKVAEPEPVVVAPAKAVSNPPVQGATQGGTPEAATRPTPAPAGKPQSAATAQSKALEEMIAQLLEPVMVRWLDNNLPRLIEKTVREEVARALKAGSVVPKP